MGTNLFGGLVSALCYIYAIIKLYGIDFVNKLITQYGPLFTIAFVMGDDILSLLKKYTDVVTISKILFEDLGMEVNAPKTELGATFLS